MIWSVALMSMEVKKKVFKFCVIVENNFIEFMMWSVALISMI